MAADAREQRKVAQIAEVVALAHAVEEYKVSGAMVEEAVRQIAEEASITGRIGTPEVGESARSAFGQDVLPQHELVVHLDATDPALDPETLEGATGAAWMEDWGALLTEDLPRFLEGSKVKVKPVVGIRKLRAEDRHDPSESLRFAIQQRRASEVFPFGSTNPKACDLAHVEPYRDDGMPAQTRVGNLAPLSRRAHRAKTFGGFQLEQPVPGSYVWTTPSGWRFLVDDCGTHLIEKPRPPELREPPPDPGAPTRTHHSPCPTTCPRSRPSSTRSCRCCCTA